MRWLIGLGLFLVLAASFGVAFTRNLDWLVAVGVVGLMTYSEVTRDRNAQAEVRVRDIPFEEMAELHLLADSKEARENWEKVRGKTVTITTPAMSGGGCYAGHGRVFELVKHDPVPALCEHQLERGD